MELSIERSVLLSGLGLAQGIVERRNTVPILSNVLLEGKAALLSLMATDLEVGLRSQLACKNLKPGVITLNARKLFEIVRETEANEIAIKSLEGDWVEIKCGRARFKMMSLDPRSFPAMPSVAEQPNRGAGSTATLKIAASALSAMIDQTIFAVSPDETRYNLSGVFIEGKEGEVRMVATDGHRLALVDRPCVGFSLTKGAILPRKGLGELRRLLDQAGDAEVSLTLESQLAWLRHEQTEVSMRLVEGEFPDYRGVIPSSSKYLVRVAREAFLAAIKRAAIFSSERYHGIRIALSRGMLTVSSTSPELGEASETIDVDFSGDEFSVGFNASYLMQALGVIPPADELELAVSDEVSPGVLSPADDASFRYVVMPMRL
ncbi:MAG TPA: DNA polymerase III subunit beta [Candidatus Binataceae bacterium]|nr:DNA polymerase III subunit beta [Candidatus Binataceae bacterium]